MAVLSTKTVLVGLEASVYYQLTETVPQMLTSSVISTFETAVYV